MAASTMAMSADFLESFARLPRPQQRSVRSLINKFGTDSTSSGLNYERIHSSSDPNMRSLRIDGGYRLIVLKPKQGDVHMLLWADKHDDAYQWAERRRYAINPETGALQVYSPETTAPDEPSETEQTAPPASPDESTAFHALKDRELVRLGVPLDMLPEVRRVCGEEELDEMRERLPVESYEALFLYMAGESYEDLILQREPPEQVDPDDFLTSLKRADTRARFVVAENEDDLEAMLNAPLEHWRVFLHPSQRQLVERKWNGPVRVLGGAGTGKTVVAMHRARWLVREHPGLRILFTTFTRNLASDLENNLRSICSPDEMKRIDVVNLDRWVSRFLHGQRYEFQIVYGGRDSDSWQAALEEKPPDLNLPDSFYNDEWEQVVQANEKNRENGEDRKNEPMSKEEYLRVSRIGRGTRLTRKMRMQVWKVFDEYRTQLIERGLKEVDDAYRDAAELLRKESVSSGYDAVIVDETQDMGPESLRLIRALVSDGPNDLFLVGDGHQRIFGRGLVVLGRCGIDIRGRSRKLRINYRTTEETRRWAARLLAGRDIDDLDGDSDDDDIRSLTSGPPPVLKHFDTREEQDDYIIEYLEKLQAEGESLRGVCIVARTRGERDAVAGALRKKDIPSVVIEPEKTDVDMVDSVRLATMHRVKGLEFDHVVLAGMNRNLVPLRVAIGQQSDTVGKEAAETMERSLVYVAATRAKKSIQILSYGQPSPFL